VPISCTLEEPVPGFAQGLSAPLALCLTPCNIPTQSVVHVAPFSLLTLVESAPHFAGFSFHDEMLASHLLVNAVVSTLASSLFVVKRQHLCPFYFLVGYLEICVTSPFHSLFQSTSLASFSVLFPFRTYDYNVQCLLSLPLLSISLLGLLFYSKKGLLCAVPLKFPEIKNVAF